MMGVAGLLLFTLLPSVSTTTISFLILSKTCEQTLQTTAAIAQASQLQGHVFEYDCTRTSVEFKRLKSLRDYSFFLGDALETACLDASQGVVPLASAIGGGMLSVSLRQPSSQSDALTCRWDSYLVGRQYLDPNCSRQCTYRSSDGVKTRRPC